MKKEQLLRYFQFALVVLAAGSIYPLIYLRTNYQQTIIEVFQIELSQLNFLYTVLGFVFIIGYFPSGWLADKIDAKRLLVISLFMTGVGGLWFAQVPSGNVVVLIFALWGVFSVFTFWASHLKVVKLLTTEKDEGSFFGILDGGRGAVEAILASIAVVIFAKAIGGVESLENKEVGLVAVIYMYSITLILLSILIGIFLKTKTEKDSSDKDKESHKLTFRESMEGALTILKNKHILLHGFIIFMGYSVFWTVYYIGGFLQTNTGANAVTVGTVTVIVLWMRPVGGTIAGLLGDKIGRAKILGITMAVASALLIIISLLPYTSSKILFYMLFVALGLMLYGIRGTYWALLGTHKVSDKILGLAIGTISLMGYFPDIIIPQVNSKLFAAFGDNGGYNAYFIVSGICGIVGVILVRIFMKSSKKQSIET